MTELGCKQATFSFAVTEVTDTEDYESHFSIITSKSTITRIRLTGYRSMYLVSHRRSRRRYCDLNIGCHYAVLNVNR